MGANINTMAALDRCLVASPEKIKIPPDFDREILDEFVDSTTSGLEKLEGAILAFESGLITSDDFIDTAQRIFHNIKGESGIMDITEISTICHHAESLLYEDPKNMPVDTLLAIKDWLSRATNHI